MYRVPATTIVMLAALLILFPETVAAQCASYDFEQFDPNTAITTQLDGVWFSTVGNSCDGDPPIYMRVRTESFGDNFASKVLLIDNGCPDFSDDYVRMVFGDYQSNVSFTLGPWATSYWIRAYDSASGGSLVVLKYVGIPGSGFVDVNHQVSIKRPTRDIRRIEIEATGSGHEAIDNLRFGHDSTPPEVEIDYPAPFDCVSDEIIVEGIVCDEDGAYDRDYLEYMRTWPNPQSDWTLVREFIGSAVCESDTLYDWDTTEPEVTDGIYVLRVTAVNECEMVTSKEVTVYVDNDFDSINIETPATGAIVGGDICFDGTAWERTCFDHYVVQYRPSGGGAWSPIDSSNPVYNSTVTNNPLASWADAPNLPDGNYYVVLAGYTTTGASESHQIGVTLDNTPPIAEIVEPAICSALDGDVEFYGTAYDAHFSRYELQYLNPATLTWTNIIPPGISPVVDGTLGMWDVSGLPPCYYVVRLRVWDDAVLDICGDVGRHRKDHYLAVAVGDPRPGDLDGDGDVDFDDLNILLAHYGT